MNSNDEKSQECGDRPCTELEMARELFSAASVTMKMAKHIRRLESKINKLERKIKIDESSSSDSQNTDQDSDSGSSDDQDTVTRGKDASKRPGNSDEEVQKKKRKVQERQAKSNQEKKTVCEKTNEQNPKENTRVDKITREVIQVKAPLVTITPLKRGHQQVIEVAKSASETAESAKVKAKDEQYYTQEKEDPYHYCCSYCNAYVRQIPNTLRGEHLITCATKHLLTPPSPDQISMMIQKTKLHEVKTKQSANRVVIADNKESITMTSLKGLTVQAEKQKGTLPPANITSELESKTKPDRSYAQSHEEMVELIDADPRLDVSSFVSSVSGTIWQPKKDLDFTCEDCGLVLAKAARLCHSRICRKVISCLYCSKVFDSLDLLKKHKPQCKELNWDQHPVRLLQHEKEIPSSVFNVSVSSGATREKEDTDSKAASESEGCINEINQSKVVVSIIGDSDQQQNTDSCGKKNCNKSVNQSDRKASKPGEVKAGSQTRSGPKILRKKKQHKTDHTETRKGKRQALDALMEVDEECSKKKSVQESHKKEMSAVRHICLKCEKEFTARRFLVSHQIKCKKKLNTDVENASIPANQLSGQAIESLNDGKSHPKQPPVFHLCIQCDHQFVSAEELREHKSNPEECLKWIKLKTRQKGLKPSSRFCSGCKKNFATQHDYIKHRNTCVDLKTDPKAHNCFQCYMTFDTKEALKNHKQFAHSFNRTSNCWVCGATFANFKEFLKHAEEHGDIKKRHPSRSRPCHVRDGHHLVLKKGEDPNKLIPLSQEAIDAIANVVQAGQGDNTNRMSANGEHTIETACEDTTLNIQQESVLVSGIMNKSVDRQSCETSTSKERHLTDEHNSSANNAIKKTDSQNLSAHGRLVDAEKDTNKHLGQASKPVNVLPNSNPISYVPLQKPVVVNEKEMVDKVTGILDSLKATKPTCENFQKLLSTQRISQPIQIKTNDPQLQMMIGSLKTSQKIKLTGNRVGYVLKAQKTDSGFKILDPSTLPSCGATDKLTIQKQSTEQLSESVSSGSQTTSKDVKNIQESPKPPLSENAKPTTTGTIDTAKLHGDVGMPSTKGKKAKRKCMEEISENLKSKQESQRKLSLKRKAKSGEEHNRDSETNSQGSTVQKKNKEMLCNNPKSFERVRQSISSIGSHPEEPTLKRKVGIQQLTKGPKHKPSILTRYQSGKRNTRSSLGNKTNMESKTCGAQGVSSSNKTPVQTIVPIGNNKVKCMYCGTIMTNITEITSHKCSKEGASSNVSGIKSQQNLMTQGTSNSLEQFSKLGLLGTVQMIRNEDCGTCGEADDDIDVE